MRQRRAQRQTKKETARRKPQKAAISANSRDRLLLEAIVDNIPDMIFVKEAGSLRFVLFNRAAEEILGYRRAELVGKTDFDFFPKEEASFFTKKDREVLDSGRPLDVPVEVIHTKSRGERYLHTRKLAIGDEAGKPLYLLGISADVTEVRAAESRYRLFADAVNNIQMALLIWKLEDAGDIGSFRLVAANPEANRVTGVDIKERVGKTMNEAFPAFLQTPLPGQFRTAVVEKRKIDINEFYFGGDGVPGAVWDLRCFPLADDCVGVAYENVSERKRVEREVLNVISREQQRIGQDLHDGVGQDLTAIAFLSKAMERDAAAVSPAVAAKAKTLYELAQGCLIKTKALSRGLVPVALESIGLGHALRELTTSLRSVYQVEIAASIPDDLEVAEFDLATQVYWVAHEALINAVRHARARSIRVAIAVTGRGLHLSVQDDGTGLPPEDARRGMGLHIMDYRARLINGLLTVENRQPAGVSVTLRVPMKAS